MITITIDKNNKKNQKKVRKSGRPSSVSNEKKLAKLSRDILECLPGEYKGLHNEHKEHIKEIKQGKEKKKFGAGGYHDIYKSGPSTIVFEKIKTNWKKNLNLFNNAFIPALLEVCGEKTIPIGLTKDKKQYSKLAECDLFDIGANILRLKNVKTKDIDPKFLDKLTKDQKEYIKTIFLMNYSWANDLQLYTNPEYKPQFSVFETAMEHYKCLSSESKQYATEFFARNLFKILLLQMYDRKPENMLVLKEKDKNGLPIIVESDFDDLDVSCIFGICKDYYVLWAHNKMFLRSINEYYKIRHYSKSKFFEKLEKECQTMAKKYTMTKDKIKDLIQLTTMKAKYLGFTEGEIIENIKSKMQDWKNMLSNPNFHNCVNGITFIREAWAATLEALGQIQDQDIADIVQKTKEFQDVITKNDYKDTNNIIDNKFNNAKREDVLHELEEDLLYKTKEDLVAQERRKINRKNSFKNTIKEFLPKGLSWHPDKINEQKEELKIDDGKIVYDKKSQTITRYKYQDLVNKQNANELKQKCK